MMINSGRKLVIISRRSCACAVTHTLHSASHSVHMPCAALSSMHANVRGGWLRSHTPPRVGPGGWAATSNHPASVIETPVLSSGPTREERASRLGASELLWAAASPSSPSLLHFLSHMLSGQVSAAFVLALTDGNRNSSTNRPIVWHPGDR